MTEIKLSNATSNIFLEDLLNRFKWTDFCGVFSSDSIPTHLCEHKNFFIISNISSSKEKGTHFVSIIKKNNIILYLDPLALYINLNEDIDIFIARCKCEKIVKLRQPIQHIKSWYCGYFTVFFLLFFNDTLNCHDKLTAFEKNELLKNDCICLNNLMIMYNEVL